MFYAYAVVPEDGIVNIENNSSSFMFFIFIYLSLVSLNPNLLVPGFLYLTFWTIGPISNLKFDKFDLARKCG